MSSENQLIFSEGSQIFNGIWHDNLQACSKNRHLDDPSLGLKTTSLYPNNQYFWMIENW